MIKARAQHDACARRLQLRKRSLLGRWGAFFPVLWGRLFMKVVTDVGEARIGPAIVAALGNIDFDSGVASGSLLNRFEKLQCQPEPVGHKVEPTDHKQDLQAEQCQRAPELKDRIVGIQ
jgi:hypothetical protein